MTCCTDPSFASCNKTSLFPANSPVTQTWVVQEGHDQLDKNAAFFCFASDYGVIDTIKITFNKEPNDTTKFSLEEGSIYLDPKKQTETDRYYAQLLKQIK